MILEGGAAGGGGGPLKRAARRLFGRLRPPAEKPDLDLAPFSEPLFVLVQRGDRMPYSAALRAATTTTRTLQVATAALLLALFKALVLGRFIGR